MQYFIYIYLFIVYTKTDKLSWTSKERVMHTWRVFPIFIQRCWYVAATSFTLTLLCICCCRLLQLSVLRLLCCSTHSVVCYLLLSLFNSLLLVCFVVWMPEKAYFVYLNMAIWPAFLHGQLRWMMIVSEPNDRRIHYLPDINVATMQETKSWEQHEVYYNTKGNQ